MRSLTLLSLMITVSFLVNAQLVDKITLHHVEPVDIVYELPLASLGFKKNDVLKEYNQFKVDYASNFKKDSVAFESVIAFLKKSKKKTIVQENTIENQVLSDLERLIKIRLAAGLLIQGKVVVTRKGSKAREKEVILKRYADMKDMPNLDHVFEFVGGNEFLSAKLYGQEIEMVEDVSSSETTPPVEIVEHESNKVFFSVTYQPEPPEGITTFLNEFISPRIKYSDEAKKARIEGKVFVKFIVNKDGTLQDFTVLKGLKPDLDDEAIRVLKESPAWKPGINAGKIVRSQYVLPITFKLPN